VTRRDADPGEPAGPREELAVSVRRFDGAQVVTASGTIDLRTRPQLARAITAAVAERPADVVIDLTDVDFMSSVGLHVLLDARQEAGNRTRLRVIATGRPLRTVTDTGLDETLAVYPARPDDGDG
jgi:anti-sigma B factor antagonist